MKKRMLSIVLMLVMLVSVVPMPQAGAASVSGQDIVNKAMEYIGKVPYVYGGTKIDGSNPGADCSGFICRIYEKFGINMWANRTKLRNCGTNLGTDLSVAQLGDIIWFDGHVAIYAGTDSKGNHTIVHETGGSFQNVVHTKVSVVNATLRGVIRIPGVNGIYTSSDSTTSTPNVIFSLPTDPNYTSKQKITNTNAVLVNKITKPAGTKVTQMGLHVYDFNGSNIGDHWDYVSNVSDSTTTFHCWYDINSEFHATLTPGNTYKYYFYGEFDGQKVTGPTFSFTTTGTRPYVNFWLSDTEKVSFPLETGLTYYAHGEFPEPYEREGYTFDGWYTDPVGGTEITRADYYRGTATVNLYPHYTKNAVVEPTPEPEPDLEPPVVEEPEEFTLVFMDLRTMESYGTYTVQNGDKYPIPSRTPTRDGYVFDGWYTSSTGGTQVTSSTTVNLTRDQNLYPHWREVPQLLPETTEITLQIGNPYLYINGTRKNIDEQGTVPLLRNSRTLLPVRAVVEAMGGTVNWINSSETVVMTLDGKSLNLQIGSRTAWDGSGNTYQLDVAPILVQSRTMLPIRFVVEFFGGEVLWDNPTETVTINYAA